MNKPSLVWEAFDALAERGSHAALSLLHAEVHGRELRLAFRWTVICSSIPSLSSVSLRLQGLSEKALKTSPYNSGYLSNDPVFTPPEHLLLLAPALLVVLTSLFCLFTSVVPATLPLSHVDSVSIDGKDFQIGAGLRRSWLDDRIAFLFSCSQQLFFC